MIKLYEHEIEGLSSLVGVTKVLRGEIKKAEAGFLARSAHRGIPIPEVVGESQRVDGATRDVFDGSPRLSKIRSWAMYSKE